MSALKKYLHIPFWDSWEILKIYSENILARMLNMDFVEVNHEIDRLARMDILSFGP
jgi:hypothetical protein